MSWPGHANPQSVHDLARPDQHSISQAEATPVQIIRDPLHLAELPISGHSRFSFGSEQLVHRPICIVGGTRSGYSPRAFLFFLQNAGTGCISNMATSWVVRSVALATIASTTVQGQFECMAPIHAQSCQTDPEYRSRDGICLPTFSVSVL